MTPESIAIAEVHHLWQNLPHDQPTNTTMKGRPILFSGPMVRAILDGRKTQTRRVVKPQPLEGSHSPFIVPQPALGGSGLVFEGPGGKDARPLEHQKPGVWTCPYGQPGDRLRVKEHAWMWCEKRPNGTTATGKPKFHYVPMREAQVFYCVDHPKKPELDVVSPRTGNTWGWRKKLGRFLPAWASRIHLEVVGVRVERLQAISEADAIAEGIERIPQVGILRSFGWKDYLGGQGFLSPIVSYASLWDSINGPGSWNTNPWVWVVEFKQIKAA